MVKCLPQTSRGTSQQRFSLLTTSRRTVCRKGLGGLNWRTRKQLLQHEIAEVVAFDVRWMFAVRLGHDVLGRPTLAGYKRAGTSGNWNLCGWRDIRAFWEWNSSA